VFLPAGTWKFWQGWAEMAAYFLPIAFIYFYFYKHDPQVVERRMQNRETAGEQRLLIYLSIPFFVGAYLIPGFDFRWGWSRSLLGPVPLWLTLLALALICASLLSLFWVLKVNSFASRTIRVEAGQQVISTGPYRIVRHPMYLACVVLWISTPLALGSWVAWPFFALGTSFYAIRLLNEEKVLREQLSGYPEYCLRTRYRLIPFVW
jgi:protein-S-isoprenylcysteine O-methyltransferase Ste14